MKDVLIRNRSQPLQHSLQATYCDRYFCRLLGLMFRKRIPRGRGLVLVQNRMGRLSAAIHMLFVGMDLTVVWLDEKRQVVDVQLARSWRLNYLPSQPAKYILECADSWLSSFQVGDQLSFEEV